MTRRWVVDVMNEIREKDIELWEHSVRMAQIADAISKPMCFDHLKKERIIEACYVHDYGKLEMMDIEEHPKLTFDQIKPKDPHLAEICFRHHQFQPNKYPTITLPESQSLIYSAFTLSCIDYLDAATTRVQRPVDELAVRNMLKFKRIFCPCTKLYSSVELAFMWAFKKGTLEME
jgi:hypothetical protein